MASTLVVNPGSSSKKYAFYNGVQLVAEYRFERSVHEYEVCTIMQSGQQTCQAVDRTQYSSALAMALAMAHTSGLTEIPTHVGVRLVAPGTYFQTHRVVDEPFIKRLQACTPVAPLHIPVILSEIESIKQLLPDSVIVAVSDSAFHANLPVVAREYSLPVTITRTHDLYRFGYHGLSVASIVRRVHGIFGEDSARLIVCHVGNGASVTAVRQGQSIETTMGFSPGSGLIMGTRAGDLDTGALLELMRIKHWRPLDAQTFLQSNGGLYGIAGEADIRTLLNRRAQNDAAAQAALASFSYYIARAIAASAVSLGGVDAIVLTATAAERSPELRTLLLAPLQHLGVQLDEERNEQCVARDGLIHAYQAPVKLAVMRTDEMGEIARVLAEPGW